MTQDDIIIIGGGPTGIWGLYHTGLRQVRSRLIESLPELGGQVTAMYPEKFIYDVGGFPRVLGRELVDQLRLQSVKGSSEISLGEKVLEMHPEDRGWRLVTTAGERGAKAVVITSGLGAFRPKKLGLPEEDAYLGRGVSYFVRSVSRMEGRRIVIVGGGDSAVDWANAFRGKNHVTLVHRSDRFVAMPGSLEEMRSSGQVSIRTFTEVSAIRGGEKLEELVLRNVQSGEEDVVAADDLLISIGFNADLGPVRNWGLELKGGKILVDTEMRTNLPGVFAAGDVVTYPGKLNLIALGFAEIAIAVKSAVDHAFPGERHGLTHSSSRGF